MEPNKKNIDLGGYKAIQSIDLKENYEDLKPQLNSSPAVQNELKKIGRQVIEDIKAANSIRPMLKALKNLDVTVVEAASLALKDNEGKMHDPTYVLAESSLP